MNLFKKLDFFPFDETKPKCNVKFADIIFSYTIHCLILSMAGNNFLLKNVCHTLHLFKNIITWIIFNIQNFTYTVTITESNWIEHILSVISKMYRDHLVNYCFNTFIKAKCKQSKKRKSTKDNIFSLSRVLDDLEQSTFNFM